ncbi:hypothetical protein BJY04DRAFT_78207 [Aspergillus karnatakaensis]|uniref:ankyrin repeat domain-containing protein n=1 Tax=Aspergillus karnatakaensis TaxID=1810916 RepID=UPI003CCD1D95
MALVYPMEMGIVGSLSLAIPHEDIFKILLDKGARFRPRRGEGIRTPVWIEVIRAGKAAQLQMLFSKGLDFNEPTFFPEPFGALNFLYSSTEAILNTFLQEGYNPQPGTNYDEHDLKWAASKGNIALVRLLISRGLDFSRISNSQVPNILSFAAAADDHAAASEIVDLLLANGLDIEATDSHGQTALLRVINNELGYTESAGVRILLERGANPCGQTTRGDRRMCPLVALAQRSECPKVETARLLLQAIDDQNIPYETVEPQLLRAIDFAQRYEKKPVPGVLGVLRRWYWRKQYPVKE